MVSVFRVREHGPASELKLKRDLDIGQPRDYEVMIRHKVLGVNRFDLEAMQGHIKAELPLVPGSEVVGVVEKIGRGVATFYPGDRIACCSLGLGGLAEKSIVHVDKCVPIPDFIDDETAAASHFKGCMAVTLLSRVFATYLGAKIVVFGPVGGVGHMLTQLARSSKCKVIGVVGAEESTQLAYAHGCNEVFLRDDQNLIKKINKCADGHGVNAVFDPICNAVTTRVAMNVLGTFGVYVPYGRASGEEPTINVHRLGRRSVYVTKPDIFDYMSSPLLIQVTSRKVFEYIQAGYFKPEVSSRYSFKKAAQAYRDLEAGLLRCSNVIYVQNPGDKLLIK